MKITDNDILAHMRLMAYAGYSLGVDGTLEIADYFDRPDKSIEQIYNELIEPDKFGQINGYNYVHFLRLIFVRDIDLSGGKPVLTWKQVVPYLERLPDAAHYPRWLSRIARGGKE